MPMQQAVSGWVDSGTTSTYTDPDGVTVTYAVMSPVRAGDWEHTDAGGNTSVVCDAPCTQAEAEAKRDAWIAAGGTA